MSTRSIGEVSELLRGVTYGKNDATESTAPDALPLLRATNITEAGLLLADLVFIPARLAKPEQRVQQGDIVMTMSSGSASVVGRSILVHDPIDATFGAFCGVLRASDQVLDRYLSYMIRAPQVRQCWSDLARGTNINNLKREDVLQTAILVPPLAEQQRIVAKLDEVDADVRTLSDRLDAELLWCAQVRLSAIDMHFNNITASERSLAHVCDVFADGDWIESKDQSNAGVRLVQTGNVGDGVFKDRRDKARWIDENTFSRLNCTEVVPGDILFSRLPDPVGRACMIPDTGDRMITAVDCTIARPSEKVVNPEFMVLFASSSRYFAQVRSMITGTTRDRISRKNLGAVLMPVPSLSEQKHLVSKAREIDGLCAEVSANIERRKSKTLELRQSVLAAAFRGNL